MSNQVFVKTTSGAASVSPVAQTFDPTPVVDFSGGSARIVLHLDNWFAMLGRANIRRWTDADMRSEYPDDGGCKFAAGLSAKTFTFIPRWRLR